VRRSAGLTRIVRGTLNAVVPTDFENVEVAAGPVAGARMLLDLRREKSYWAGTYEPWVQDTLAALLAEGGVAWDVGAYIGYHTLLFYRLCGPQRVVAVEPNAESRERLEANLAVNHALGVHVIDAAVSDHAGGGSLILHRDPVETEVTSDVLRGATAVRLVTLDALLDSCPIPHVVKLDVEGSEAPALRAAKRLLHEVRPTLVVEVHKTAGIEALAALRDAGYRVRAIDRTSDVVNELRRGGTRHVIAEPD